MEMKIAENQWWSAQAALRLSHVQFCQYSSFHVVQEEVEVVVLLFSREKGMHFSLEKASPQISGLSRSMRLSSEICGLGFLWAKLAQLELANL